MSHLKKALVLLHSQTKSHNFSSLSLLYYLHDVKLSQRDLQNEKYKKKSIFSNILNRFVFVLSCGVYIFGWSDKCTRVLYETTATDLRK
jgi:hypothetical protein